MQEEAKKQDDRAMKAKRHQRHDRVGDGAMSPLIRQLILSYGDFDPERTWDPNAFARRAAKAA